MARHSPPSLRRRLAVREPKRRFTIVCEGKNTEPEYFRALRATIPDALVELVVVPAAGMPTTIAQRSVALVDQARATRRQRGRVDSYEESDEVWAVFDRDEHPNFDAAVGLCVAKRIGIARSNPCFEVWLILHKTEFDRPDGRHAVQVRLQSLCPEYDATRGKRPDCARLIEQVGVAERRADRQLAAREAEGAPYGPPSTTVFNLTRAIRRAAELAGGTPPPAHG